ncbi:SGNH/GDSL hydrolase family protein [candidate division GN15 bacterium]|nr:SGNH/GDSL hydrolase family protein [candidate division GN15 bacterium]
MAHLAHIALIGDSILDNAPYVAPGKDVTSHLRSLMGTDDGVTLLARDGSTLADIRAQAEQLPQTTSHIIFSCGGNDALGHLELLAQPAGSVGESLVRLNSIRRDFLARYQEVLLALVKTELPVVALTIYHPQFDQPDLQEAAEAALCLFNDGITRTTGAMGVQLIDLRTLLDDPGDMANPIEPSDQGGLKIARAIRQLVLGLEV